MQLDTTTNANYGTTDLDVWSWLHRRQEPLVKRYACHEYLSGLECLNLAERCIPDLNDLNGAIDGRTEWRFIPADGATPPEVFYRGLNEHQFPVTVAMRKPEELEFSELPDFFHDLFGHGPALMHPAIAAVYTRFSEIALRHLDDEAFMGRLRKLFWITMEMGLVRQDGELKVYGGAILSSHREMANVFNARTPIHDLDVKGLTSTQYRYWDIQNEYFVITSFDRLVDDLSYLEY